MYYYYYVLILQISKFGVNFKKVNMTISHFKKSNCEHQFPQKSNYCDDLQIWNQPQINNRCDHRHVSEEQQNLSLCT